MCEYVLIMMNMIKYLWTLFLIFKKNRGGLSFLLQLMKVSMNFHQYPWIFQNILESVWINSSDYARTLNMHDHLTCSTGFWKSLWFQKSQGSEYGTVVYARATWSSEYFWLEFHMPHGYLNMPLNALMSLNMREHGRILLNLPELARKCLNKLLWPRAQPESFQDRRGFVDFLSKTQEKKCPAGKDFGVFSPRYS